jgi:hypothetical protein
MIKRLSFKVSLNPDYHSADPYISDEIEDQLGAMRIKPKQVINITESEKDLVYSIVIYYRTKN